MAVINVKGKQLTLPDKIVEAGEAAIRAALAPDFPDAMTMHFEVAGAAAGSAARVTNGAPAVVTSRSTATTKG